jgi:hypothetical protein
MIRQRMPQQFVGASGPHSWALRKNSFGVDPSDDVAHDAPLGHGLQLPRGERGPGTVQVLMTRTFFGDAVCCLHSVSMAVSSYSHKTLVRSVENQRARFPLLGGAHIESVSQNLDGCCLVYAGSLIPRLDPGSAHLLCG